MTFLEKYIEEHGKLKKGKPFPSGCPSQFQYEDWIECATMDCVQCWRREITNERENDMPTKNSEEVTLTFTGNFETAINQKQDVINHPDHYCRDGATECLDEMIAVFGTEAVKHFCLCNVWKYRYRAADKNGEEDIKKSDFYMRKYKELSNE